MLLIQIYIGERPFAINVESVEAVVPSIPLRPLPSAPKAVVGAFEYRGVIVPVVDLCQLLEGRATKPALSSRFIVVSIANAKGAPGESKWLALYAEKVTETVNVEDELLKDSDSQEARFLGKGYQNKEGQLIRLFEVDMILSDKM